MGSAVSSVTSMIGNSSPQGAIAMSALSGGNPGSALGGYLGNAAGAPIQGLINGLIPEVPIADQTLLQNNINQLNNRGNAYYQDYNAQMNQAGQQLNNTQNAIGQTQGAIDNAQQVNQGPNSNVNNAIGLVAQTAAGGGPAQDAAKAQLQQGTDQAIKTQQAMANSGNLSQMISGQKTAMDNAASLNQQNANQAALLRANMSANAQQNYTGASAQQAGQAAQNAALQQQQAGQQAGLYNTQLNNASALGGLANSNYQAAAGNQENALGIQQQALGQTADYRAKALGGLMNGAGGIAGAALGSDEDSKTDIEYATPQDKAKAISKSFGIKPQPSSDSSSSDSSDDDSKSSDDKKSTWNGEAQSRASSIRDAFASDEKLKEDIHKDNKVSKFFDAIDPVTFKYKDPTGEMGKTPGTHIGVIAQQVEKAPGGASMVIDTPKGKAIDLASAVGTLMASAADINDRMKLIEEVLKSKRKK